MSTPEFITILGSIVGPGNVLTGDEVYSRSSGWGRHKGCEALAIVRPRSTEEVSAVLRLCHEANQPVVPHGGMTGLVEGNLANGREIALSLELMNEIEELDETGLTLTAQAGVVLQRVHERAEAAGLMFPLDLGARGSAMIGGLISTNAGGNRVIRYGMTRNLILGLEAVLADGTIISSMNRVIKNNAGYDIKHLFIGSEGTLGIVTRAVLRLLPQTNSQHTALAGVSEFSSLSKLLKELDRGFGGSLTAFEMMEDNFFNQVTTPPAKGASPFARGFPYYVLVEMLGGNQELDEERFESSLASVVEQGLASDCVIAKSKKERDALWALRDDVEQVFAFRPVFTFDVSLPIRDMESYIAEVKSGLGAKWPEHRCFVFGHLGDGNLHLVISTGAGHESRKAVEEIVYGGLRHRDGSVAAEHGIGLEKRAYLSWSRNRGRDQPHANAEADTRSKEYPQPRKGPWLVRPLRDARGRACPCPPFTLRSFGRRGCGQGQALPLHPHKPADASRALGEKLCDPASDGGLIRLAFEISRRNFVGVNDLASRAHKGFHIGHAELWMPLNPDHPLSHSQHRYRAMLRFAHYHGVIRKELHLISVRVMNRARLHLGVHPSPLLNNVHRVGTDSPVDSSTLPPRASART
jgi:FAD/FMN-containing dehydrogenase